MTSPEVLIQIRVPADRAARVAGLLAASFRQVVGFLEDPDLVRSVQTQLRAAATARSFALTEQPTRAEEIEWKDDE